MEMRIGGLASGMDIDKIVEDLMRAERIPLEKMKQEKQILEWRRADYREMNNLLRQLDETIFSGILMESTFLQKTVSSTNEDAVSAKALSLENNVTTQISVSQLAKVSSGVSQTSIYSDPQFDPNATLESQSAYLKSTNFGTQFTLKVFQPDGTVAQQTFTVDPATESLNDILDKINASGLGVTAYYDEVTGKVAISTNHTGDNQDTTVLNGAEIVVDEMDGQFFSSVLQFGTTELAANGQNAVFTLNGLTTERTTNTFTINDVTYTLKQVTTSPVTISTATDVEGIFESIKGFVEKYNETIEKINQELNEERYRDYPPLTDRQREELSEHEIELWREKARSGMLANDRILPEGLSQMRLDLYSPVQGLDPAFDQLSEIGISTSDDYTERGKLIIDEAKLKEAIRTNPQAVYELFTNDGATFDEKGIALRLRETIGNTIEKVEQKAGNAGDTYAQYFMGRKLNRLEEEIDAFQARLDRIEDRYWRQFTAMEQAIQRANQQTYFLMQQFSGA